MTRTQRLLLSLGLNAGLVGVQVAFGLVAHSTGLVADAGHNLIDVGAMALALVAARMVLRPAGAARTFGNHRATVLAALANALLLSAVTVVIVVASVERLLHPEPVHAGLVVAVASVGLVVNGLATLLLRDGSHDLNMRAALAHTFGDTLASGAVIVAAVILLAVPSATWLDPASALVVAVIVVVQATGILRESVSVLLESTPSDIDLGELSTAMIAVDGVGEVHDLHVWSLSSDARVLSAHLVLTGHPTLEEAQVVGERVKVAIGRPFDIAHSTLELECERCQDGDADPCRMEATGPGPLHHH